MVALALAEVRDGDSGGRAPPPRVWIVVVVALIVVAAGGWLLGRHVQSPGQAAARAAPPVPSWITANVEQRVLAQTIISRGDVHPQVSVAVNAPASIEGAPVVTAINVKTGDSVSEGTRLLEVSGRPVFVLQGDVPVYRSLKPQMTGSDVAELQASLTRLGCDTTADAGVYAATTKTCVAKLYADAGYAPIPSSATEQSDLTAAQQALADAQAAVDSAQLTLDTASKGPTDAQVLAADTALKEAKRNDTDAVAARDTTVKEAQAAVNRAKDALARLQADPATNPTDLDNANGDVQTATDALATAKRVGASAVAAAEDAVNVAQGARNDLDKPADVSAQTLALSQAGTARDRAQATLDQLQGATGPTVPQGEVIFAPSLPARVQQIVTTLGSITSDKGATQADGQPAAAGGPLATLAAGNLVVSMTIRTGDQPLVRVGTAVDLLDEQSNTSYPGSIESIAATTTTGSDGQAGYGTVIAPATPLPASLTGANLRVTITAASTQTAALVVPLAAISSSPDGSTNVSVLRHGDATFTTPEAVAVKTGISADGFVAVEPAIPGQLDVDDAVVVGR
jgi:hypothetical protein